MNIGKIDTHHHFLPSVYIKRVGTEALARMMPNRRAPEWSAQAALEMMEERGISQAILSISAGPELVDAPALLRDCNEAAAKLRTTHPGRFGSFASLPLPDIDASLREIAYCIDTLKVDGFILFTNYTGRYLGDPLFAPVMAELNRRGAVTFVHPNTTPYDLPSLPPASVIEFPFDTTRAAVSLIMAGALNTYPAIRFILSHAGGTLPYLTQRVAGAIAMSPELVERVGDPMAAIRSFYYDTALSVSDATLSALFEIADPQRILFGTDFPMAPTQVIRMFTERLEESTIEMSAKTAIFNENATALFARESCRQDIDMRERN